MVPRFPDRVNNFPRSVLAPGTPCRTAGTSPGGAKAEPHNRNLNGTHVPCARQTPYCRVSGSGSEDSAMVSIERTGRSLRHTSVHVLAAAFALFSVPEFTVPPGPGTACAAPAATAIEILEANPEPHLHELEEQS